MPTATDLVTDLPADFEVFGQAVDTDFVDLLGGTTGQILSKTSATDLDFTWIANDQGDITGVTAGNGITVTDPTGPVPTVAINTAVTADLTTAQTLTNKKLSDSTTTIVDVSDATKAIKFDVAGTTAVTGTIATAFTTAKTLTLPDATDTLVGKATTDTLTNKTLTSPALTTPTISTATTNGDLLYGTGSGALQRLGIGSTSNVLTVTGGVPVWAAPAGGGGMTLLHTVTLSTTSHTQASISGAYKNLYVVGRQIGASTSAAFRLRIQSKTTGYIYAAITGSSIAAGADGGLDSGTAFISTDNGSALQFTFYDYAESNSEKIVFGQIVGNATGDTTNIMGSPFNWQANITSLTFTTVAGTANLSGTILIYGVS
jgi:hypothetical protein